MRLIRFTGMPEHRPGSTTPKPRPPEHKPYPSADAVFRYEELTMPLQHIVDAAFEPALGAVENRRIPGAILGAVTTDGSRAIALAGQRQWLPEELPLGRETWFDLASLTKVMVTVPEVLRLVEEGSADLDDPLGKRLPNLAPAQKSAPVRDLTLRQCLVHSAGLPPFEPIHQWGATARSRWAAFLSHPWAVGEPAYSDIGYILLGLVIEQARNRAFGALVPPPGTALAHAPEGHTVAATEDCPWRGRVLVGETHDDNAWSLGGAAGHAGLFGTVDAVLDYGAQILTGTLLSPAAMAEMLRPQAPTRCLGWERRYEFWSGGGLCSPETVGHTGFTGVGLWIDRPRGIAWTLLTNRVHPSRSIETGILDLRRAVGNRLAAEWSRAAA